MDERAHEEGKGLCGFGGGVSLILRVALACVKGLTRAE